MLVSITNAAKELGVSTEHVRRAIRAGRWPCYRLGPKAIRIDLDEIKRIERLDSGWIPKSSGQTQPIG